MNRLLLAFAVLTGVVLSATTAHAQKNKASGPKPTAPKVHAQGQKSAKVQAPKSHGKHSTSPKVKGSHAKTSSPVVTTATTKKSRTTTTTVPPTGTLTPVQAKLQKNTNLANKLQSRLPAGTDLMTAAEGFRNLGQFVAAVNNSYNHKLSFTELKTRMVDQGMSLGQAKKDLRATTTTTPTTTTSVKK